VSVTFFTKNHEFHNKLLTFKGLTSNSDIQSDKWTEIGQWMDDVGGSNKHECDDVWR